MISIEEVRQESLIAFKAVHDANFPSTLVNYPNHVVVDIEKQSDPFVSVSLDLTGMERAAIGEREILVPGSLNVYFYYRTGTGTSDAYTYSDMLNQYLGMTQVGALQFRAVQLITVQTFPEWEGLLNTIRFDVVKALAC